MNFQEPQAGRLDAESGGAGELLPGPEKPVPVPVRKEYDALDKAHSTLTSGA